MIDTLNAAQESKIAVNEIITKLKDMNEQTERGQVNTREGLASQLMHMEQKLDNVIRQLSHRVIELSASQFKELDGKVAVNFQELFKQLEQESQNAYVKNIRLHEETSSLVCCSLEENDKSNQKNQKMLSSQLEEINKILRSTNEAMNNYHENLISRNQEQMNHLRKTQLRWFIGLSIIVIIGYFI